MTALHRLDLAALSDVELRELLEMPEGRDGLRYYLSKRAKIAYLTTTDEALKETLLSEARKAQREHHQYLAARRRAGGKPDRHVLIEQKLGGVPWRFIGLSHGTRQFRDEATGRKAKIAYVLENTRTGVKIRVTRSTVNDAHERLGLVIGWPMPAGRPAVSTRHGEPTAAQLISHRDRQAQLP